MLMSTGVNVSQNLCNKPLPVLYHQNAAADIVSPQTWACGKFKNDGYLAAKTYMVCSSMLKLDLIRSQLLNLFPPQPH